VSGLGLLSIGFEEYCESSLIPGISDMSVYFDVGFQDLHVWLEESGREKCWHRKSDCQWSHEGRHPAPSCADVQSRPASDKVDSGDPPYRPNAIYLPIA